MAAVAAIPGGVRRPTQLALQKGCRSRRDSGGREADVGRAGAAGSRRSRRDSGGREAVNDVA